VKLLNFKCLRDVQVDLERFTMFVGPNASGKSSIIQAIQLFCRTFREAEGGLENDLWNCGSRGSTEAVELAGACEGRCFRYRTRPLSVQGRSLTPSFPGPGRTQSWSGEGRGTASFIDAMDWSHWTPSPG